MAYSLIVFPFPLKNYQSVEFLTIYPILYLHCTISPFTIAPFNSFTSYHIHNYSGKMSKFIHEYQGSEEYLLCEFEKVKLIKVGEVF